MRVLKRTWQWQNDNGKIGVEVDDQRILGKFWLNVEVLGIKKVWKKKE